MKKTLLATVWCTMATMTTVAMAAEVPVKLVFPAALTASDEAVAVINNGQACWSRDRRKFVAVAGEPAEVSALTLVPGRLIVARATGVSEHVLDGSAADGSWSGVGCPEGGRLLRGTGFRRVWVIGGEKSTAAPSADENAPTPGAIWWSVDGRAWQAATLPAAPTPMSIRAIAGAVRDFSR